MLREDRKKKFIECIEKYGFDKAIVEAGILNPKTIARWIESDGSYATKIAKALKNGFTACMFPRIKCSHMENPVKCNYHGKCNNKEMINFIPKDQVAGQLSENM